MQENAVKGGQKDCGKRKRMARKCHARGPSRVIDGNLKLNKALWHLAERLAELKAK
jgi:hypothetical protein